MQSSENLENLENLENYNKQITLQDTILDKNRSFIFYGCWGTYCKSVNKCVRKEGDILCEEGRPLLSFKKKTSEIEREKEFDFLGSKDTSDLLKTFCDRNEIEAVILAGDNVYKSDSLNIEIITNIWIYLEQQDNIVKTLLKVIIQSIFEINVENQIIDVIDFIYKNQYKDKYDFLLFIYNQMISEKLDTLTDDDKNIYREYIKSNLVDMDEQYRKGFLECFHDIRTQEFLLGVGNHDIDNCDVLNKQLQLNNQNKWILPGLSFNKVYTIKSSDNTETITINFIFIDTNMYSVPATFCKDGKNNNQYHDIDIQNQKSWIQHILESNVNDYYFIIGHEPFMGINHKKDVPVRIIPRLKNDLEGLYIIRKFIYMCADSHSQQLVKHIDNIDNSPLCIISGSGGASLDVLSNRKGVDDEQTTERIRSQNLVIYYQDTTFGFVHINIISKHNMFISFLSTGFDRKTEVTGDKKIRRFSLNKNEDGGFNITDDGSNVIQ